MCVCIDWYIFAIPFIWQYYTGDLSCKPYVPHTAIPSCLASPWRVWSWEQTSRGHRRPIPNTCPCFFMFTNFLWRETDRLDWHLKASFRLSYGLLKPCCKIYEKRIIMIIIIIMDGGLSHIKCGKSNFIFVFSNNNIDKKCLWKVSILYCGPEIDVSVWKINKINSIVIWLVLTVLLYFIYPDIWMFLSKSSHIYSM